MDHVKRDSITAILQRRSQEQGDALAIRFLADGTAGQATDWTYRGLAEGAAVTAAALGDVAGRRVALAVDPGLHYVAALFGGLCAGATVVPTFPPAGRRATARFLSILGDCSPAVIIASRWLAGELPRLAPDMPEGARAARWVFVDDAFFAGAGGASSAGAPELPGHAADPALLQYTSGSTGDPKGIILTHANIMSNCRALHAHMGEVPGRVGCSWLPPYHDMGLLGTILLAVHGGWPLVMLSPVHFVQQPYRWLKAITDYGVTISVAPNFALDMCVDTITDEEIQSLDLSALRQLYCGAEPVRKATLDRFSARFAACGYRESAIIPCYGMAEATLFVSGKPDGTRPRSMRVDKAGLELGAVRAATAHDGSAAEVMSCGRVAQGHEVVIVDPNTRAEADPGTVGEIWVAGPSVAAGYAGRPDLAGTFTATVRGAGDTAYLRTGDLGYLHEGELYVTGRIKDVIIVAGRNLYPQDIEDTVLRSHGCLRKAAAFSVQPRSGEERLVVVAEVRRAGGWNESALSEVRETVIAAVTAEHSVGLDDLYVGPPGTVATTTSGKVRRAATRQGYEHGSLKALPERVGAVR